MGLFGTNDYLPHAGGSGGGIPMAGELNTILHGDLYAKQWDLIFPANAVKKTPNYVSFTDPNGETYANGVRLNRTQAAAAGAKIAMQFVAPVGCTSVVLSVDAMLPSGLTNQTIVIGVYQLDGTTSIQTAACVLTASMQTFSTAAATVVAGTEYRVVIKVHETGVGTTANASAVVSNVKLVPSGSLVAPFNTNFVRFNMDPKWWHDSRISDVTSRKQAASPFARFVFRTKATTIGLEYIRTYGFSVIDPAVLVDGQMVGTISLAGSNALNIATFTLPGGAAKTKTVEIIHSPFNNSAAPPAAPNMSGAYLNALYVPRDSETQIVAPYYGGAKRRLMIYGDSIAVGFGHTRGCQTGLASVLRQSFPGQVIMEAHGSRSLAEDCGSGGPPVADDAAKRLAFVRKVIEVNPTDLWICIGTNDYGGSYWAGVAQYSTCHLNLLNQLVAALPACRIWVQSPLIRATETANASGWTMPQLRTQISTDVAAVTVPASANIPVYVEGSTIITTGGSSPNAFLNADGVHTLEAGTAQWAEAIRTNLGW